MKQVFTEVYEAVVPLGTTANLKSFPAKNLYGVYIQVVTTDAAALNTSLKVQLTNDLTSRGDGQNWVDFTELAAKNITGNGSVYWELGGKIISADLLRIVNTNTGGTGNAKIIISGYRM